jgi:uncharacterized protein (TIGR02145 family)
MFRILALLLLPVICLAQVNSNGEKPTGELLSNEISPNEMKRNASFNVDEIKVRWKKAALENCTGVPCVVTPPAPSFTCGTSTISDIDNNPYETVLIGTQCWTKQNLKVSKYNDGTAIDFDNSGDQTGVPTGYLANPWSFRTSGAYTIYANESSTGTNATNYGFLYNWFAAAGIITSGGAPTKNICPVGWHVPTDPDWTTLIGFHGGISGNIPTLFSASPKMKQKGTTLWNNPNNGTDDFGFTALPAGARNFYSNEFEDLKSNARFWIAPQVSSGSVVSYIWLDPSGPVSTITCCSTYGISIRCLKD